MIPYLGANMALVGTNTFGKPVGQFAFDLAACDDRLRLVAFKTDNADNQGDYFTGLASVFPNTCRADDNIFIQLGDPSEIGRAHVCTPVTNAHLVCRLPLVKKKKKQNNSL